MRQKTQALVIDFNNAEHLGSKEKSKRTLRTVSFLSSLMGCLCLQSYQGTPIFIARAVQQGKPVLLPKKGGILSAVPSSPETYTSNHPDRIQKFPIEEDMLVRKPSADSTNRKWRHELDHDAESVFWVLLYWAVAAQPEKLEKEKVVAATWANLTGSVDYRTLFLQSLGRNKELTHSVYQPLVPLLSDLADVLIVDRHWLDDSETRNDPEYVPEVFQRLILQFILDNRDKAYMTIPVVDKSRDVKAITRHLGLPSTLSSRWHSETSRKRPSPQPSRELRKRPRVDTEVVGKVGY